MTREQRPILVTGCPRSGTTWVGRVLGAARLARYSREPFFVTGHHPGTNFRAQEWFEHLRPSDTERIDQLSTLFSGRARPFAHLNRKAFVKHRIRWRWMELVRSRRDVFNVVKDPLAVMSAETLANAFDARVVFMIRRPEFVVSSHLTRGWDFGMERFIEGMRPLKLFEDQELDSAERSIPLDPIHRVSHMWRLLSCWARTTQERNPDWVFCRHGDLLEDPVQGFEKLCERIGIDFCRRQRAFLDSTNRASKSGSEPPDTMTVRRSIEELRNSKSSLPPESAAIVAEICGSEERFWYPELESDLG